MKKLILVSLIALAACGQKPAEKAEVANTETAAPAAASSLVAEKDGIKVFDPRVRIAPNGMDMTAAYLTVKNDTDKEVQITAAEVGLGKTAELHTHVKGADGQLTMTQVKSYPIPAKSEFALAPGGAHIMVMEIKAGGKAGDKTKMELKFDTGLELEFDAPLVDDPTLVSGGGKSEHIH